MKVDNTSEGVKVLIKKQCAEPECHSAKKCVVGDVCAMQEVDIQGALTCGFRAGLVSAD